MRKRVFFSRGRLLFALGLSIFLIACSAAREEDVSYTVYRSPVNNFEKMQFIGLATNSSTSRSVLKKLSHQLDSCGQFEKATMLKKLYKLPKGDDVQVRRAFKKQIKKNRDDRYAHGVLYVDLYARKKRSQPVKNKVVTAQYNAPFDWQDSFETTADLNRRVYSFEEIGRKPSYSHRDSVYRKSEVVFDVRYSLYNARLDKLVFDKTSKLTAELVNYSKRPDFSEKDMYLEVYRQILNKIVRNTCPKVASVERKIFAPDGKAKVDRLIRRGVELASDGLWDKAASLWQNAILLDNENLHAHHNLGVYYEKTGNIPKAIDEFDRVRTARESKKWLMSESSFDEALHQFRPIPTAVELKPKLMTVSSSNWVTVVGGESNQLAIGQTYPIYRTSKLVNSDYSPKGVQLLEVGKIQIDRVEGSNGPQWGGRIVEFAANEQIRVGDTVLTK